MFVFPSPAGELFTQATARELAGRQHLVFGCGRYEGIDERVFAHAASLGEVRLVSLGDYVLNGGEVAAMAMIEAIGRLIPGVVGNPESLVEESHEDGLLEYPSYTKPAAWRGRDVPPVLLSGNHGAIAAWRREQQIARTRERRPDLLARRRRRIVTGVLRPQRADRRTNLEDPGRSRSSADRPHDGGDVQTWPGSSYPLGATFDGNGTNFALFSEGAERVELCLFGDRGKETRVDMIDVDAYVWHAYLPQVRPGSATATGSTARTTPPAARGSTRASSCSTRTPKRSRDRSSGVSRSSGTTSATRTRATTRTPRHR